MEPPNKLPQDRKRAGSVMRLHPEFEERMRSAEFKGPEKQLLENFIKRYSKYATILSQIFHLWLQLRQKLLISNGVSRQEKDGERIELNEEDRGEKYNQLLQKLQDACTEEWKGDLSALEKKAYEILEKDVLSSFLKRNKTKSLRISSPSEEEREQEKVLSEAPEKTPREIMQSIIESSEHL